MKLARPDGMVGLLTPSGIASDKTAAPFFRGVATRGRLKALYDFENKKIFFPDVHASFKFLIFVASPLRKFDAARCAFYLRSLDDLENPERCFPLTAEDFARVNPNTGTAPIFRTRRDAELTAAIYRRLPILVDRSGEVPIKAWPVQYATMFHMTNDSHLFHTRQMLEEEIGAYPIGGNRWRSAEGEWVPLYVGRMVHQFDHRAASVVTNDENLHNAALSGEIPDKQKADPQFLPTPQYWVLGDKVKLPATLRWVMSFRDIARATDARTIIAAAVPFAGFGNKLPILLPNHDIKCDVEYLFLLGNLNAIVFDFVSRSKVHSTSVNWYIVEQLPVVAADTYHSIRFGSKNVAEIVRETVLELTYTAHDMAPLAEDLGYLAADGTVKPPFIWDKRRRLMLRAKLDAVYFMLYGVADRNDVRYIYSTFPIVERDELRDYGSYASCELCLAWMNALKAGDPDAKIELPI
ncbi:MAG: hypothetical protein QOJ54_3035 [Aliidongia sp.]|jgi:hypothetical protein|nr:hypothetical protein [Aliidongia sp.]